MNNSLKVFWYSRPHLNRGNITNFGDELSYLLIQKISGKNVKWIYPLKQNFLQKKISSHILGIGSILHFSADNSKVWGSGLIEKKSFAADAKYFAVRGKYTRRELLNRGYEIPEIYGDPGLLTPLYYPNNYLKKFKIGIIPHYVEFDEIYAWYIKNNFSKEFLMIDLRNPVELVLKQINECDIIISSSLHGIIIPQAYRVPTLRVSFTDKILGDGIKYQDYFDSVGIAEYSAPIIKKASFKESEILNLVDKFSNYLHINEDLDKIQNDLLNCKPF